MYKTLVNYVRAALFTIVCLGASANVMSNTVLILGDSLSAAYGIDPKLGWVELLKPQLPNTNIINGSISGETTSGGLKRLPNLLAKHKPTLVVVELGANDGLRGQPLSLLKSNLTAIVDLSQAIDAKVLLLEMHVPPNYGRRYSERFNQTFHTIAADKGVTVAPFFLANVSTKPELIQADGLHPKAEAQPIILKNVLPHIKPLLD
ncbi:MAG: acyl-CoA thioesterase-1 [Porticoccus sp.]|jgi:acyl-CoA thioesterase-1